MKLAHLAGKGAASGQETIATVYEGVSVEGRWSDSRVAITSWRCRRNWAFIDGCCISGEINRRLSRVRNRHRGTRGNPRCGRKSASCNACWRRRRWRWIVSKVPWQKVEARRRNSGMTGEEGIYDEIQEVMPMQGSLSIERMCQLAGVSRAGFYRSLQERGGPVEEEMETRSAIQEIAVEHRRRYGYRRITAELRRRGMRVNHKRVAADSARR